MDALLVDSLVAKVKQLESSATAPAAPEGALDLLAKLRAEIEAAIANIDPMEAEALLSQVADVVALLASGQWVRGTIALMGLLRAYRAARMD